MDPCPDFQQSQGPPMQRQTCQGILWVSLSLLCQQMCTVTSCMQTFHFHFPVCAAFYHRTHLESKLVSVSTRLQYKFSPPFQQPRSCSLSTHLFLPIFQNRNTLTCHCTSESAHWNCSWKGIWWPCPKQYKDFGFYCWRGKTTNFFILVLEHSPVVLSRLWSLRLNSTHEYTCVCVCVRVCMHMYKNIWRVSSFQKIWAHVCHYIVGLNLALRYCVYLAAVFYMKLVWRKQKIIWSPCKNLCDRWCWSSYSVVQGWDFIFLIFFLL